jgi:NADPH-dependent 2,4-dienoyl-CoA reductase/sulfur reductase-like enzyme
VHYHKPVNTLCILRAGASEKTLKRLSIPYRKVYIHAGHHAGYYPGAKTIDLKLLFSPKVSSSNVLCCTRMTAPEYNSEIA